MKQTEDQYPVAALWEQLSNVANAKQGNSTNNKWYDWFNTKVEVAKSVGVSFDFEKIWEYCTMEAHKAAYTSLRPDEQEAVRVSARERPIVCSHKNEQLQARQDQGQLVR